MFNRVSAVVLFVKDFQTSLAFYRDTLGLAVAQLESDFVAFKMNDQDFAINEISAGAAMIGVEVSAFEDQTGRLKPVLLCARVDNIDEAYETLKARGVEFTRSPISQPWGLRMACFRDPEGNIWELAHEISAPQNN